MNVEAGTILEGIEVMVTHNQGAGIAFMEIFEEHCHGAFLRLRTRVLGSSLAVETALVAHTDAVTVVVLAVGANLLLGSPRPDHSFAVDIVVVADVLEPAMRYVVAPTFRECEPFPFRGGRAVDDDQCDGPHG